MIDWLYGAPLCRRAARKGEALKENVILAGKNNGYMKKLTDELRGAGHHIIVGAEPADMLVFCIEPEECGQNDYERLLSGYEEYGLGLLKTVSAYLPLFRENSHKRFCFLTTLRSCINNVEETGHWERIVLASCNMAIRMLFNRLSKEGFTFRIFAVEDFTEESASYAADYFVQDRSMEPESDMHSDEKRLVVRDKYEKEYAW